MVSTINATHSCVVVADQIGLFNENALIFLLPVSVCEVVPKFAADVGTLLSFHDITITLSNWSLQFVNASSRFFSAN